MMHGRYVEGVKGEEVDVKPEPVTPQPVEETFVEPLTAEALAKPEEAVDEVERVSEQLGGGYRVLRADDIARSPRMSIPGTTLVINTAPGRWVIIRKKPGENKVLIGNQQDTTDVARAYGMGAAAAAAERYEVISASVTTKNVVMIAECVHKHASVEKLGSEIRKAQLAAARKEKAAKRPVQDVEHEGAPRAKRKPQKLSAAAAASAAAADAGDSSSSGELSVQEEDEWVPHSGAAAAGAAPMPRRGGRASGARGRGRGRGERGVAVDPVTTTAARTLLTELGVALDPPALPAEGEGPVVEYMVGINPRSLEVEFKPSVPLHIEGAYQPDGGLAPGFINALHALNHLTVMSEHEPKGTERYNNINAAREILANKIKAAFAPHAQVRLLMDRRSVSRSMSAALQKVISVDALRKASPNCFFQLVAVVESNMIPHMEGYMNESPRLYTLSVLKDLQKKYIQVLNIDRASLAQLGTLAEEPGIYKRVDTILRAGQNLSPDVVLIIFQNNPEIWNHVPGLCDYIIREKDQISPIVAISFLSNIRHESLRQQANPPPSHSHQEMPLFPRRRELLEVLLTSARMGIETIPISALMRAMKLQESDSCLIGVLREAVKRLNAAECRHLLAIGCESAEIQAALEERIVSLTEPVHVGPAAPVDDDQPLPLTRRDDDDQFDDGPEWGGGALGGGAAGGCRTPNPFGGEYDGRGFSGGGSGGTHDSIAPADTNQASLPVLQDHTDTITGWMNDFLGYVAAAGSNMQTFYPSLVQKSQELLNNLIEAGVQINTEEIIEKVIVWMGQINAQVNAADAGSNGGAPWRPGPNDDPVPGGEGGGPKGKPDGGAQPNLGFGNTTFKTMESSNTLVGIAGLHAHDDQANAAAA